MKCGNCKELRKFIGMNGYVCGKTLLPIQIDMVYLWCPLGPKSYFRAIYVKKSFRSFIGWIFGKSDNDFVYERIYSFPEISVMHDIEFACRLRKKPNYIFWSVRKHTKTFQINEQKQH